MFVLKLSGKQTILDTFYKIRMIFNYCQEARFYVITKAERKFINDLGTQFLNFQLICPWLQKILILNKSKEKI